VFLVGCLGSGCAAQILFESESLSWDSAPVRKARASLAEDVAGSLGGGSGARGYVNSPDAAGAFIPIQEVSLAHRADVDTLIPCLTGSQERLDDQQVGQLIAFHSTQETIHEVELSPCLSQGNPIGISTTAIAQSMEVRRLMPVECERLQGFSDGFTGVNSQKDGPRYKQLGNAVSVPVARWIGERILKTFG
jgi:DNA (cytosine-5)-methyltransferase 1